MTLTNIPAFIPDDRLPGRLGDGRRLIGTVIFTLSEYPRSACLSVSAVFPTDSLTRFELFVVIRYVFEHRSAWFILGFAVARTSVCLAASCKVLGLGLVEVIWALVAHAA